MNAIVEGITSAFTVEVNRAILRQIRNKPNSMILNLEDINDEKVKEFLASLHTQIWGHHTLYSADGYDRAAHWFTEQLRKFSSIPKEWLLTENDLQ
mgnify:CR=1 FL=1